LEDIIKKIEDRYGTRGSNNKGKFVEKPGARIERKVRYLGAKSFEGQGYKGKRVTKFIYRFKDNDNNLYVWFTTALKYLSIGEELDIRMTIKEHNIFNDDKQNIVNRVHIKGYKEEEDERKKKFLESN